MTNSKPKLLPTLLLRCPHCGKESLRKKGSWFEFKEGCSICNYRYEREAGYFTGASWMINYTVISLAGVGMAWYLVAATPLRGLWIASMISLFVIVFGLWFFPYGKAIWMYFDHLINPLSADDR
jgi:hypothetical protein